MSLLIKMRYLSLLSLLLLGCVLSGCERREEVVFYAAPKDPPPTTAPTTTGAMDAATTGGPAPTAPSSPDLHWSVPPGWTKLPDQPARVAGYAVSAEDPEAVLTIIAMPESIPLANNVNRWEGQTGLPPTSAERMSEVAKPREIAGESAVTIDLKGPEKRMLAAIIPHGGQNWYIKLLGATATITAQEQAYAQFLSSLHFATDGHTHELMSDAQAPDPASTFGEPMSRLESYDTPPGWVKDEPRQMREVSFRAGDKGAEMLAVRLTAGNIGPLPDNINRWRQQAGLEPTTEQLTGEAATIGSDTARVFDFTGPQTRVRVVYTVRGTDVWFFKLQGPKDAVAEQVDAFEGFLKSVKLK